MSYLLAHDKCDHCGKKGVELRSVIYEVRHPSDTWIPGMTFPICADCRYLALNNYTNNPQFRHVRVVRYGHPFYRQGALLHRPVDLRKPNHMITMVGQGGSGGSGQ